jgi:hypothetical protein
MRVARWWRKTWACVAPRRKLRVIAGDSLPPRLPRWDLVLAREETEDWCVGLRCPCGCGRAIELLLIPAYSARCRPLIPPHAGPRFRAMPAGDSAACRPLLEVIPSRG